MSTVATRRRDTRTGFQKLFSLTFILTLHMAPLLTVLTGVNPIDWLALLVLYLSASFGVGVGLHRYFSHRVFKTSRFFQLVMAIVSCTMFTDPISFAGKHRLHHRHSDGSGDVHSPKAGFWFCWVGSLLDEGYSDAEVMAMTRDLNKFPELVWLHRFFYLPGALLGLGTYAVGGFSMLAIGFCLSRVLVLNSASAVNYFCHKFGSRRYPTRDRSTNNAWVAFLTLGEGWHNNHHFFPQAARAGFFWWEVDVVYGMIKVLAWLGIVWDVRGVPHSVLERGRDESLGTAGRALRS